MKKIIFIVLFGLSLNTFAETPLKAFECMVCHGNNGNSYDPLVPRISGLNEKYILKELNAFKEKIRHDKRAGIMFEVAENLSVKQMTELASFFSQQKRKKILLTRDRDPGMIAKGKDIFENGIPEKEIPKCIGCHSNTGYPPMITRQHSKYIIRQFTAFKEDLRGEAVFMPTLAKIIDNESIHAVAYYLESL